ncbi:MAG: ribosomal protein [Bacilli bacterium]|nr:ribosomal protein [Bacilli bacterium]
MSQPKLPIKKGDKVQVISGRDKGKQGQVLASFPTENRVLVENVNLVKKHMKPDAANPQGGVIEKEAPIHVSNVMVLDPKTGFPTRTGKKILADGSKVRYAKKSGEHLS